jgi:hypothetical protein
MNSGILQLSQLIASLFSCVFAKAPFFQFFGITSFYQIILIIGNLSTESVEFILSSVTQILFRSDDFLCQF